MYGNEVVIAYPGGVSLAFAHLDTVTISADAAPGSVMADTPVGTVGSTGLGLGSDGQPSTAYHLHYEQRKEGAVRLPVIERVQWEVGKQIADDHDNLANHPGIANTSANCGGTTPPPPGDPCTTTTTPAPATPAPGAPAPVLSGHLMAPVACATIGPSPTLVAWPTATLDDVAISRVVFHARWSDGAAEACTATAARCRSCGS